VRVNNNLLAYFSADAKVHQQDATVQKTLSGTETFEILLDAQIEGTFQRERYCARSLRYRIFSPGRRRLTPVCRSPTT
jgi:hypothetical protein